MSQTRTIRGRSAFLVTAACAVAVMAAAPGSAGATVTSAFAGDNACLDMGGGPYTCPGIVHTWDGQTNIDVNLFIPTNDPPAEGFPTVGLYHGWGGSKFGASAAAPWLAAGYAVFSMSDRGWGSSCGAADPNRTLDPTGCAEGYNHLLDTRYEVRDAQYLLGLLVDDGITDPDRIGATGGSYGGGLSMALAALKDRMMLPDGSLTDWESPLGTAISLAAAAPEIPWTDLAYSLQPNGHTLDYVADAPYMKRGRIGVMKQSFVSGLYATGQASSNYAPTGTDPDADLNAWYAEISAGEPYDQSPLSNDIVDEITTHHSSYYIDDSTAPAPLLINNGWTDDLFPPDEAIRFYNRTRTNHPGTPISLIFTDHGHQRGQNKDVDTAFRQDQIHEWFDYYVKGVGSPPFDGVQTLTQTCPDTAPSGGASGDFDDANTDTPFQAASWAELAPGEIRFTEAASKTVVPGSGSSEANQAYDPIAGPGACAAPSGDDQPGLASYRLPAAPAGGFTLMGSPTVIADINSQSPTSQLTARLVDVAPDGNATLVGRGIYRPEINPGSDPTRQVFQLHPNGWKFDEGHIAKLELMPSDSPYGRTSNGQAQITVSNLELRLPVIEAPNGGLISEPAPKVMPAGYQLAADFRSSGGDADEDGIPDSQDQCPNAKGPVSNGGCPVGATPAAGPCGGATTHRGTRRSDAIVGTSGRDRLLGGRGNDRLRGKGGADCVKGQGGNDRLSGGAARDKISGGRGADRISSRDGTRDVVNCGGGEDRVKADRADVLKHCEHALRR